MSNIIHYHYPQQLPKYHWHYRYSQNSQLLYYFVSMFFRLLNNKYLHYFYTQLPKYH
nr:MAG TPA: hypothetical protein [Caudoviricetes sp.]